MTTSSNNGGLHDEVFDRMHDEAASMRSIAQPVDRFMGYQITGRQQDVFAAILSEIAYQDAQVALNHGDPAPRKSMEEFVLYMEDYLHELRSQLSRTWGPTAYDKARHTMRKVITLGVRALEAHGAPHRERHATTYTGRKPE